MKLLASDFDDTIFFKGNEKLIEKNVSTIKKFVDAGNKFCIITGRNYPNLKRRVDQYKIPYHYLICEDGAKLFHENDIDFHTTYLEKEEVEKVVEILKNEKWHFYLDDGFKEINDYNNCVKVVIDCIDETEKNYIVDFIKKRCDVHIYASRRHVNIIHKSVNKKVALDELLNEEKIDANDLYVIGDSDNDYEMINSFKGAIIKKHHPKLNNLDKKEYEYFYQYVEELMKD